MTISNHVANACPDYAVWAYVATGFTDTNEAALLLSHAADCATCAAMLRDAIEATAPVERDDASPNTIPTESIQQAAQRAAARSRRKRGALYLLAVAAAIVGLILIPIAVRMERTPAQEEALLRALAAGYETPESEPRIPGAAPPGSHEMMGGERDRADGDVAKRVRSYVAGNDPVLWHAKARLSIIDGNGSAHYFERAREAGANSSEFWTDYAVFRMKNRDAAGARTCLDRALRQDPNNAAAYFNLALLAERQGRRDESRADLEEARRRERDHAWQTYIDERLDHFGLGQ